MKQKAIILTGVGFIVGVGEALVYYNMGKSSGGKFQFKTPPAKEFFATASMVMLTSVITTALFKGIELMYEPKANAIAANDKNI